MAAALVAPYAARQTLMKKINNQQPTSNNQHPMADSRSPTPPLGVRCWMFDVGCFPFIWHFLFRAASQSTIRRPATPATPPPASKNVRPRDGAYAANQPSDPKSPPPSALSPGLRRAGRADNNLRRAPPRWAPARFFFCDRE